MYIQSCVTTSAIAEPYTSEEPFLEKEASYESLIQQYDLLTQEMQKISDIDMECMRFRYRIGRIDNKLVSWEGWLTKINSIETEPMLFTLVGILNEIYYGRDGDTLFDGKLFSGKQGHRESPLSVNLDLVPVDFDVNQPISPFYIGHIDASVIAIGDFHLTLDILSTDDVFENALRALMIIKTGRKNEHRGLIDQLLTSARTKFKVTKQKAADYLERIESYQKELREESRCLKACRDSLLE